MSYYGLCMYFLFFYWASLLTGSQEQSLTVSENNSSKVFVELLRGRDGLPGSDGPSGPAGLPGLSGPQGKEGPPGPKSGGATYIRWGKSSCPTAGGTEEVYTGIAAGSYYNHPGGGANYLCMPTVPEYTLPYQSGMRIYGGLLYGTEYEFPEQGLHDHNVPCAVCHVSTRAAVVMIPANVNCPTTWTREYYGYLMTDRKEHKRTMYECVDVAMESLPGSSGSIDGALFYNVETQCHVGIPCPPYINYKELSCVVCTK